MAAGILAALIVADDLTGAADTAVGFALAGYRSHVDFDQARGPTPPGGVVAVDTDTRRASPQEAASRVAAVVRRAPRARRYLKKIDSALRGNLAAEIPAMLAAAGRRLAVCAPAFPATGRVTHEGEQWAGGGRVGDLRRLLAGMRPHHIGLRAVRGGDLAVALSRLLGSAEVVVVDAHTDDDLRRLVRASAPLEDELLWIGSGGLGAALAGSEPQAAGPSPLLAAGPATGAVLIVVGSPAGVAAAQAAAIRADGVSEVLFPGSALLSGDHRDARCCAGAVATALAAGQDVLVSIGGCEPIPAGQGRTVVSTLATALAAAGVRPSALVATGGETARAVSQALGVTRIDLAGQLEPGVVYGRFADGPACPVVTKAGTFGDEGSLIRAVRALRRPEPLTTLHGEEA